MEKSFPKKCFCIKQANIIKSCDFACSCCCITTKNKSVWCFIPDLMVCSSSRVTTRCMMNCPLVFCRIKKINIFMVWLGCLTVERHFKIYSNFLFGLLLFLFKIFNIKRMLNSSEKEIFIFINHVGDRYFFF